MDAFHDGIGFEEELGSTPIQNGAVIAGTR
jgi:hypothetical protein